MIIAARPRSARDFALMGGLLVLFTGGARDAGPLPAIEERDVFESCPPRSCRSITGRAAGQRPRARPQSALARASRPPRSRRRGIPRHRRDDGAAARRRRRRRRVERRGADAGGKAAALGSRRRSPSGTAGRSGCSSSRRTTSSTRSSPRSLRLRSSDVHVGESSTLSADEQARLLGEAWERAAKPEPLDVRLVVHHRSGRTDTYHLGAHPPSLTPADLDLIHRALARCHQGHRPARPSPRRRPRGAHANGTTTERTTARRGARGHPPDGAAGRRARAPCFAPATTRGCAT